MTIGSALDLLSVIERARPDLVAMGSAHAQALVADLAGRTRLGAQQLL